MSERTVTIDGASVPRLLYGTAWKEDETEGLTMLALRNGFRGIDTANQRKHYHEAAVGRAVHRAIESGLVTRDELFLQTKFTFRDGQDHRLPYDPNATVATQVAQSFSSSLDHFKTDVIDSFVLHGPSRNEGLVDADWEAWRAMEDLRESGRCRLLGVSNVSLAQLEALFAHARVRPRFVQNRCYASRGWDREVRRFCAANEIVYQGFSLLTANRQVLSHPELLRLAGELGRTPAQLVFRFALEVGIVPLIGTTDPEHMRADFEAFDFHMGDTAAAQIERIAAVR